MVRVKICGIRTADAVRAAAAADWIGLNFFPASPRALTPAEAAALPREPGPARVGLFVDPREDDVDAVLAAVPLDILQLYTSSERAAHLRRRFGLPVWRAVGVARVEDLPGTEEVDGFVIEAKPPPGATRPGGNAQTVDWSLLRGWTAPRPWLLAGGLHPGNVGAAILATGAVAVDVASGVESAPGVKDPALIRAFLAASRDRPS